jgi:hypothetical protein
MGHRAAELEINEDIAFERREWRFQDAGAAAICLLLLAAIAGLFGSGAFSERRRTSADGGTTVEYQRYERLGAPAEVRVELRPGQARAGRLTLLVEAAYLGSFKIESITPRPEAELAGPDGVRYRFEVAESGEPSRVLFELRARKFGSARGGIGVDGRPAAVLRQFVYP